MRDELRHRPLVLLAAGLILGIVSILNLLCLPILLAGLLWLRQLRPALLLAAGFAIGAIIAQPPAQPLVDRKWVDGIATVASVPRIYADSETCEVEIDGTKLSMTVPAGSRLVLGDRIRLRGVAKPFREGTEGKRPLRGIVGRIRPLEFSVVKNGPMLYRVGEAWRHSFIQFSERTLPTRAAAAVEAVCFNVDTALDPEARDALSRSGTVHIVSASGLHVAIFALFLTATLALMPLPRPVQIGILAAVLITYAAATGMRPPVVRAVLMAMALAPAYLARREPDALSAIGLAACVQLLWQPSSVFDLGFQLSFLIVAALVLFATRFESSERYWLKRFTQEQSQTIRQGLVATGAAAPIVAHSFGIFSLTSIPANLLIALSLPPLVIAAISAHALSFVAPTLAEAVMAWGVAPLSGWIYAVLDAFGGEWSAARVPAFSGYWLLPVYAVALLVWRARHRPA